MRQGVALLEPLVGHAIGSVNGTDVTSAEYDLKATLMAVTRAPRPIVLGLYPPANMGAALVPASVGVRLGRGVGVALGAAEGRAVGSFVDGASDGQAVGASDGAALGDVDGACEGAAVFPQQPKNMISPVGGDMPGQHWPSSCMARHSGWTLQSPAVVGLALGRALGETLGLADGDTDGLAVGLPLGEFDGARWRPLGAEDPEEYNNLMDGALQSSLRNNEHASPSSGDGGSDGQAVDAMGARSQQNEVA